MALRQPRPCLHRRGTAGLPARGRWRPSAAGWWRPRISRRLAPTVADAPVRAEPPQSPRSSSSGSSSPWAGPCARNVGVATWDGCFSFCSSSESAPCSLAVRSSKRKEASSASRPSLGAGQESRLRGHHCSRHGAAGPRRGPRWASKGLHKGTRADYQRALDAYASAKFSGDYMSKPDEITNVTKILDDGRYAIACVRARAAGQPLPHVGPPCFFDPRHGMAVEDVLYAPPGGVERDVPACALDAERVKAGAEPDTRQVMVGSDGSPTTRAAAPTRRTPPATSARSDPWSGCSWG